MSTFLTRWLARRPGDEKPAAPAPPLSPSPSAPTFRFRKVVESISDGLLVLQGGGVAYANPAFLRALELGDFEELVSVELASWVWPGDREKWRAWLQAAPSGENPLIEVRFLGRNPRPVLFEVVSRATVNFGEAAAEMVVLRDVTSRRALEREIAEISHREQQRIARDLHDGVGQLLAGTALKAKILESILLEKASSEARLASEVSQLATSAAGQLRVMAHSLAPVEIQADGLLHALLQLADSAERLFSVSCFVEEPVALLTFDAGEATQLYRIAQEAITNAVRHGQARTLRLHFSEGEGGSWMMIDDDGTGISEELLKAPGALEAASSESSEETPLFQAGYGLRIMRYRANTFGGNLRIERAPQGGTRIACRLPPHRTKGKPVSL